MFIQATKEDCDNVAMLATRTFSETFGHLYRPENLAQHIKKTCSADYFRDSLDEGDTLMMLQEAGHLIGYGKVGRMRLPYKSPLGAQEIHRVYVAKEFQRRGHGKAMMLHIMALPRIATAPATYLSVWEENISAQALYKQYGFEPVGRYLYQVGDQFDNEIIMARKR